MLTMVNNVPFIVLTKSPIHGQKRTFIWKIKLTKRERKEFESKKTKAMVMDVVLHKYFCWLRTFALDRRCKLFRGFFKCQNERTLCERNRTEKNWGESAEEKSSKPPSITVAIKLSDRSMYVQWINWCISSMVQLSDGAVYSKIFVDVCRWNGIPARTI